MNKVILFVGMCVCCNFDAAYSMMDNAHHNDNQGNVAALQREAVLEEYRHFQSVLLGCKIDREIRLERMENRPRGGLLVDEDQEDTYE